MQADPDTPSDWDVRPYRPGDEVELAALFSQVFGKEASPEWWLWKLKGRPSPVENVWVAVTKGERRIVGQYAGVPVRLKLRDSARDLMLSVDAVTSPDYRRRGALTRLEAVAHEAWASAGVAGVLMGLPNEHRDDPRPPPPGWVTLFPLAWLRLPLRFDLVAADSGKAPGPLLPLAKWAGRLASGIRRGRWQRNTSRSAGVSVEEVTSTSTMPALDALWSRVAGRYPNLIVRDGEWVRWRYLDVVGNIYRILLARYEGEPAGYLTYRMDASPARATGAGYITDLFTAPDAHNVARALLGTALDDLWRRKAGSVMASAVAGSRLYQTLKRVGFRPQRAALSVKIMPLAPSLDMAMLWECEAWHLTAGDFDLSPSS